MIEKFQKATVPLSHENTPVFHHTEEAIAKISSIHEACFAGRTKCEPDLIMDILQHSELASMEEKILSGNILDLDKIKDVSDRIQGIELAGLDMDEESLETLHRNALLLSNRYNEIRRAVNSYTQSLLTFHRLNQRRLQTGDVASVEDFEKADADRRRIHNGLFDSIIAYQNALGNINILDRDWKFLPEGTITSKDFFPKEFTDKQNGRELVMLWAVATRLHKYFDDVRKKASEEESSEA